MVKFIKNTSNIEIFFPKHVNDGENCKILLKNNITNKTYQYTLIDNDNLSDFYKFELDLNDLEDGEYTYNINDSSNGLLKITEKDKEEIKNNKKQEYTQYNGY